MKRSKQRDAVLQVLSSTTSHPTADTVYNSVRDIIPSISLGTVYRNLNVLSENGEIRRLDLGMAQSRFDYNVKPHDHFVCQNCGSVLDVMNEYDNTIDKENASNINGSINYHTLVFYGICDKCSKEK
ncbi:MAG TPA: transcriptional repressor [Candidatus Monoglobus merdigallinarum]|uniref:Transcriptional repressor n=1 Tax=Candidatus Monoglobus merdigallinarum TaxID=2838698 RepID=A0A9D1PQE5_9FIRM|nr:transcriptional repressor [Candidatus Monoglobus merdigallinarum]